MTDRLDLTVRYSLESDEPRYDRVVGGFPVGADGRVHTTFHHNPSSLRLSSADPNLQNIPRVTGSDIAKWVKDCFVAPAGYLFWARDFAGIEAKLVGYFSGSATYCRAAGLGVHAFLASHIVGRPASWSWSDADLVAYFTTLKKEFKAAGDPTYDTAKRIVHGSNYMMTPRKMVYEYPETFQDVRSAARLQGLYFELFPEIRKWHRDLCLRVDGTKRRVSVAPVEAGERVDPWTLGVCYAQNPYGYVHRFYNVLDWQKVGTEWIWSFGEDAKRLVSFLPQSTAAAIIKKAARELWETEPDVAQTLRLLIHDEIFGECLERQLQQCLEASQRIMEAPQRELPLDPAWGMGEFLAISTEAKVGRTWSEMQ